MLHILLWILKLIGILLLSILGLIVLLLALVLLVPIRYRGVAQKRTGFTSLESIAEVIRAEGKITWLLGALALSGNYDGELNMDIRIFGHSLLHKKPKKKRKKAGKAGRSERQKKKTEEPRRPETPVESPRKLEIPAQGEEETITDKQVSEETVRDEALDEEIVRNESDEPETGNRAEIVSKHSVTAGDGLAEAKNDTKIRDEKNDIDVRDEKNDINVWDEKNDIDVRDEKNDINVQDEKNIQGLPDIARKTQDTYDPKKDSDRGKKKNSVFSKIGQFPQKVLQKFRSIVNAIKRILQNLHQGKETLQIYLDFWKKDCTQAAKDHILKEIKYLLRHILPRKAEGTILFGFEDPATTGQVLGILCVLAVFTGNHLEVQGDFERKILEGEVAVKGHIRLCHIAKSALVLFADKKIRATIRAFRRLTV